MIKTKRIFIPIYGEELFLILGGDLEKVRKYVKKHISDDIEDDSYVPTLENVSEGGIDGACFIYDDNTAFIWMQEIDTRSERVSVLAHECLHITFRILTRRGIEHSRESEEAYTYLFQFIFQSSVEWFVNQK